MNRQPADQLHIASKQSLFLLPCHRRHTSVSRCCCLVADRRFATAAKIAPPNPCAVCHLRSPGRALHDGELPSSAPAGSQGRHCKWCHSKLKPGRHPSCTHAPGWRVRTPAPPGDGSWLLPPSGRARRTRSHPPHVGCTGRAALEQTFEHVSIAAAYCMRDNQGMAFAHLSPNMKGLSPSSAARAASSSATMASRSASEWRPMPCKG